MTEDIKKLELNFNNKEGYGADGNVAWTKKTTGAKLLMTAG